MNMLLAVGGVTSLAAGFTLLLILLGGFLDDGEPVNRHHDLCRVWTTTNQPCNCSRKEALS